MFIIYKTRFLFENDRDPWVIILIITCSIALQTRRKRKTLMRGETL